MTGSTGDSPGSAPKRVLIIVENLPVPFDRRVWNEATTLKAAGYEVSVICPKGKKQHTEPYEVINDIHIHRHSLWEASGAAGYFLEYGMALFHQLRLAFKVFRTRGFDVIQACNPPDTIFLVAMFYKLLGKKFIFDHHDINPEMYVAKFERKDIFYRLLVLFEWLTFKTADVSIATNNSYRQIALERGRKAPEDVFVVRSGPNLDRVKRVPPNPERKRGRPYLVGYVGVIGEPEGIDLLVDAVTHITRVRGRDDIAFTIMGDGPAREEFEAYAKSQDVMDHVVFTGRVTDEELLETLSTADVCVNPDRVSPYNDKSTMNKIMEYMALERPIVQFEMTEGRYSAQDASAYAEPNNAADFGDKILELIDDPERRRQMGEIGRARLVSELAWPHQAPLLLKAYEAALMPRRARHAARRADAAAGGGSA